MKFQLNQTVIFEERKVIIWDYSHRYSEYSVKRNDGTIVYGVSEDELSECKVLRKS